MKPLHMFFLTADKLVRCQWDDRSDAVEPLNSALDAATLTEIHVSEDAGESWKWLPSGGIDYRDIWAMQVHPTRANELYVGTLPAAVYVSENGGRPVLELSAFRQLPEYDRWTFPPPPHTAHVRCINL